MENSVDLRAQKMSNMRQNMKKLNVFRHKTIELEHKLQKINRRKSSGSSDIEINIDLVLSKAQSFTEQNSDYQTYFSQMYKVGDKIGQGAHGVVKKCYSKFLDKDKEHAVKIINLEPQHVHNLKQNFLFIKQLSHENIIKYSELFFEKNNSTVYLVMEYLPYPDLTKIKFNSQEDLVFIMYQLLDTVKYIHQKKICHRDIKPDNILFDQDNRIKLIDFGISKKLLVRGRKKQMLTNTGTLFYRAPQTFLGGYYDEKVDIWALGITFFKIMYGVTPFQSEFFSDTISNIINKQLKFPLSTVKQYSKSLKNLIKRLLYKNPQERLSAADALKDMLFINILKQQQQFTRSLTISNNIFRNVSHDIQRDLQSSYTGLKRQNTNIEKKMKDSSRKSLDELFQEDKSESMIYGIKEVEDELFSPLPLPKRSNFQIQ